MKLRKWIKIFDDYYYDVHEKNISKFIKKLLLGIHD